MSQEDKKHEIELEKWKYLRKIELETGLTALNQTFHQEQATSKSAILLNGGAAIAMLAFIGHLFNSHEGKIIAKQLSFSLVAFSLGTSFAVMSVGASYISYEIAEKYFFETRRKEKKDIAVPWWKRIWPGVFFFLVFLSYSLFLYGLYLAFCAINS